jgi:hypothetical protein
VNNRIVTPNGQPAIPQIDAVQLGCEMLLNGRGEYLDPPEQAKDIVDRIEALMSELGRLAREKQGDGH